jgi:hypothetical protein
MALGDRASTRYTGELVGKKPSVGRWIMATMDAITGSTPDTTEQFDLLIKDKQSGAIVFRETVAAGPGSDEAIRLANERLEQMTVAEFCDTYSIPPPGDG